jgi:hypothetical protein
MSAFMTWKSYAAVSGAGLLATYLVSAPPTIAPGRPPAARPDSVAGSASPSADIQQEAARLQTRVSAETDYQPPARNPFRFGARPAAKPTGRASSSERIPDPPAAVSPEPSAPPPPPIRLSGIVTNTVDGVRQRAAVLTTVDGVITAREGETAGAYRIVRVDEDAVDVIGPDGVTRRLTLR